MQIIINAENSIVGRLASYAAKELLKGSQIAIVNTELAVISGKPKVVIEKFSQKIKRGDPYHGPFHSRDPARILKRTVRGMLPHKKPRGRQALKRLKVYISVPPELKDKEFVSAPGAENKLECKFITLGKLSEALGVKKRW